MFSAASLRLCDTLSEVFGAERVAMENPRRTETASGGIARFGIFELDLGTGDLTRRGRIVRLQDQQAMVLKYLVERAGSTVSRDELRTLIWPEGTFVEFEVGLYNTMNRLRRALGDSASSSNFIETVPKQGYRFIAAVDYKTSIQEEMPAPAILSPEHPEIVTASAQQAQRKRLRRYFYPSVQYIAILAAGVAAGILVASHFRPPGSRSGQVYRDAISVEGTDEVGSLAISPAGDQIVFEQRNRVLYRRYLDQRDPRPVRGTEGGRSPFFSPDGQSLGFFTERQLKIVRDERVRVLADLAPNYNFYDAVWGEDGFVYFNNGGGNGQGIWRVPAKGGNSQMVVSATHSGQGAQIPFINQILVRPRHLMVYSMSSSPMRRSLRVRDLDTHQDKSLVEHGIGGRVLSGRLVYYYQGSLFTVPFNSRSLETSGTAVETVKDVDSYWWQSGRASLSDTGTLAYVMRQDPILKRLEWMDADGAVTPLPLPADRYQQAVVSPRGDRLAIVRQDQPDVFSVWTYELRGGAWRHILDSHVPFPRAQWSPDGSALVVGSETRNRDFPNLYRVPLADPTNIQRLTEEPDFGQFPLSWSAKANAILFIEGVHEATNSDILVLPLWGNRRPRRLIASPGWDRGASFSPDGEYVAYQSDLKGRAEIFVQPYDLRKAEMAGPPVQISGSGGQEPVWSPDGRTIYYLDPANRLIQVRLSEGKLPLSKRTVAESVPGSANVWTQAFSMAPDGRLLIIRPLGRISKPAEIHVIVNWAEELKRLQPLAD